MRVLVLNSGSSSLKYQLLELEVSDDAHRSLAKGAVERIGERESRATHDVGGEELAEDASVPDHAAALRGVIDVLEERGLMDGLGGIGHRVVHGGERFIEPTLIDDEVAATVRELTPLAPLHNPANATGIEVARELRPDVPQVAVFDTSFHGTMPPAAYRYAVPTSWYDDHGVRRYGMHGTSHAYVARRAAEVLGSDPAATNLITAHLGNGASITAVEGGRSVDTSMGLSPLEGLVMGTRSGDLDPTVPFHVMRTAGLSADEVESTLNHRSGLKGLAEENDVREIEARAEDGDEQARLALEVMCHRLRKYIGAYTAVLGRVDGLVFTAGIGEHSPRVRAGACAGLEGLGILLDEDRNADPPSDQQGGGVARISRDDSPVTVLVVPTNEELEIATQTAVAVRGPSSG